MFLVIFARILQCAQPSRQEAIWFMMEKYPHTEDQIQAELATFEIVLNEQFEGKSKWDVYRYQYYIYLRLVEMIRERKGRVVGTNDNSTLLVLVYQPATQYVLNPLFYRISG